MTGSCASALIGTGLSRVIDDTDDLLAEDPQSLRLFIGGAVESVAASVTVPPTLGMELLCRYQVQGHLVHAGGIGQPTRNDPRALDDVAVTPVGRCVDLGFDQLSAPAGRAVPGRR